MEQRCNVKDCARPAVSERKPLYGDHTVIVHLCRQHGEFRNPLRVVGLEGGHTALSYDPSTNTLKPTTDHGEVIK